MSSKLSEEIIRHRMIEWRNLKKLHQAQGVRIQRLEAENATLKTRIAELEAENMALKADFADIKYQLSQMQVMVFKKKRKAKDTLDEDDDQQGTPKTPRTPASYQRPIPKDEEVTHTVRHMFSIAHGTTRIKTYFVEDIPLGMRKIVTKHEVEQWYDAKRRVWVSESALPASTVVLGDNVRVLIATLVTIENLSYDKIRSLLSILFGISVSDGEIANILDKEAALLRAAEDTLLASIREEESHHMDESRFDVRGETRHVWGLFGGTSGNGVYRLGVSRGKGIAEELRGRSKGILVSDDYGAYRVLARYHQLCWAHLIRKFRDLAQHDSFTDDQKEDIRRMYRILKEVYRGVVSACAAPLPEAHRDTLAGQLTLAAQVIADDPKPVVRLKTTLMKNIPYYLTCLSFPKIALTNNLAERSLRHIVLKRKISFGCKSDKGAQTLGTLFSVLLSLYRKDPMGYMGKYIELRRV